MPAKQVKPWQDYLWNSDEKTVLGRTGTSWFKIFVFYVIFYVCLAAFWVACLVIFLQTLNYDEPRWNTKTGSIIGSNPGLGYRPRPPEDRIESTLIMFNDGAGENWLHWVTELNNTVNEYKNVPEDLQKNGTICDYATELKPGQYCKFDIAKLSENGGGCTLENTFGYRTGKPCIIVKLNKIFDWDPVLYNTADDLPSNMPKPVQEQIRNDFALDDANGTITKQNVWITCEGENPADIENIGEVKYYPGPGMPTYYYPFNNTNGYQPPLVAVEFATVAKGVLINIECKAWAKNIKHDRKERKGSVHFELMVD